MIVLIVSAAAYSQDTIRSLDTAITLPAPKEHSAHKATIYSAILPGLGQAYNEKYWKIPVIYGGFATLAYFINSNTKEFRKFKEAYNYVSSGDSSYTDNDYVFKYSQGSLQEGRDYYRRNMELSYILSVALYLLNIVDAAVDAHLWDFDVSDDLSMRIQPIVMPPGPEQKLNGGLSVSLQFH